jgi:hypothetical protein
MLDTELCESLEGYLVRHSSDEETSTEHVYDDRPRDLFRSIAVILITTSPRYYFCRVDGGMWCWSLGIAQGWKGWVEEGVRE